MTQANRYKELAALTKRADNLDPAYHAAFYLLSYDPELYETARRFVNVDGIGFTGIKRATRDFDERTRFVIDIAQFGKINEIYAEYFANNKPARSLVAVKALPLGVPLEIEAIALHD